MQISFDIKTMTLQERAALAGFIVAFPPCVYGSLEPDAIRKGLEHTGAIMVPKMTDEQLEEAKAAFSGGQGNKELSPLEAFGSVHSEDEDDQPTEEVDVTAAFAYSPSPGPVLVEKPPVAAASNNASVIVDKEGLPWDERIHSSARKFTANGVWLLRRGVDKALVPEVQAQLRQVMGITAPAAPVQGSAIPKPPVETSAATVIIPPPPAEDGPAPTITADRQGFVALIGFVTANRIPKEEIENVILVTTGGAVSSMPMLGNRFDLIPAVFAALKEHIGK